MWPGNSNQSGLEYLLADEITIDVVRRFLSEATEWSDYPHNAQTPERFEYSPSHSDDDVRRLCRRVLKTRKGSSYARRLVELCSPADLPSPITNALTRISHDFPNDLRGSQGD